MWVWVGFRLRVTFSPGRISAQCSVEKIRFDTGGKKKKVKKRKTYQMRSTNAERMRLAVGVASRKPRLHCSRWRESNAKQVSGTAAIMKDGSITVMKRRS